METAEKLIKMQNASLNNSVKFFSQKAVSIK